MLGTFALISPALVFTGTNEREKSEEMVDKICGNFAVISHLQINTLLIEFLLTGHFGLIFVPD